MASGSPPETKRYGVSGNSARVSALASNVSGSANEPFISFSTTPERVRTPSCSS